jgi:competence protein ComEC
MRQPPPPQPRDLRLAVAAIAAWTAVLWGLSQPSRDVGVVALAAFALAVLCVVAGRWRGIFHVLGLALCTVTVVLAPLAARLHRAHEGELSALAASRTLVTADLVVTADPRPLAAKGAGGSPRTAVDARITAVNIAGRRSSVSADVLVLGPADAWRAILPGQRVRLDARLAPPLPDNLLTATLTARTDPELLGRPPWWQQAAGSVRSGLQRASSGLPTLPRGLLPALVDGDTSQLDPVLAERFRVAGLTHLVAVSGENTRYR